MRGKCKSLLWVQNIIIYFPSLNIYFLKYFLYPPFKYSDLSLKIREDHSQFFPFKIILQDLVEREMIDHIIYISS